MKPHPRIRKALKWTGAAATMLLAAIWIGNAWGDAYWGSADGQSSVYIQRGRVLVSRGGYLHMGTGFEFSSPTHAPIAWWPTLHTGSGSSTGLSVPLWIPTAGLLMATGIAWRLDTLAHRRARLHLCPKCRYPRTGLPPHSPCPECNSLPPPSVPNAPPS